jgi:hypothetical protein
VLLPDFERAVIDPPKVVYLLGTGAHTRSPKARFFRSMGFRPERWDLLAQGLRQEARMSDLRGLPTPWGTKWIATGPLDAPDGRVYNLVSVWIETDRGVRLVAAYPRKDGQR